MDKATNTETTTNSQTPEPTKSQQTSSEAVVTRHEAASPPPNNPVSAAATLFKTPGSVDRRKLTSTNILALQRVIGNRAVGALLAKPSVQPFATTRIARTSSSVSTVIQRLEREELWSKLLVTFVENTPALGDTQIQVSPQVQGQVQTVPEEGDVPVLLLTGDNKDTTVNVDPKYLVAAGKSNFEPNRRVAEWGCVWEVKPGIGVEYVGEDQEEEKSYVDFVKEQVEKIGNSVVGKAMLGQFDPSSPLNFTKVQDQDGAYKGITVVISQPPKAKKNTDAKSIETLTMGGRNNNKKGGKIFGGPQIPSINFHNKPEEDAPLTIKGTKTQITSQGVVNHPDFPESTQSFDVVLFHEFNHAYLKQLGVADRLRQLGNGLNKTKPLAGKYKGIDLTGLQGVDPPDAIEEELVVGIQAGKGLALSENAYRCDKGTEKRTSYKSAGVQQDDEAEDLAKEQFQLAPNSIYDALKDIGLTEIQAKYVVFGTVPDVQEK